ncbi:hypothetical protein BDY17DRAFT_41517 [Neohortaea acidophila]|uniref:Zn(2)-C6 fungal-type domain-containing protein n=1 Tax=Neohortaea acidophila TaxID=245834 RepID=A0A6A6PI18_9PEZI|nr:uncharacterized protein BDY17DRAFT_41517 [Neohortaea acidophila]KAF2479565.1 hypothetical protein BDY17DRAFT_41517 [Neohortaea acidophila]
MPPLRRYCHRQAVRPKLPKMNQGNALKRRRTLSTAPSRGACHTCRARRVKCDETRPHCLKCALAGRQCLGYREIELAVRAEPGGQLAPCGATFDRNVALSDQKEVLQLSIADASAMLARTRARASAWDGITLSAANAINSRSLEQLQMLSNVLEHHFPSRLGEASSAKLGSFLGRVPALDLSSPLVSHAVDSLCFAHFGAHNGDKSLLRVSQVAYGHAINALRREVTRLDHPTSNHRKLLYAIMVIGLYDDAMPLEHRRQNSWEVHYWGVHEYLQRNLRLPLLWLAMLRRRPLVFARSDWVQATTFPEHFYINKSNQKDWYMIASRLLGALGRAEQLMSENGRTTVSQLLDGFHSIDRICQELNAWLLGEREHRHARQVALKDEDAFDPTIEEHIFILTSRTFDDFLDYKGATTITRVSVVWFLLLTAECMKLRFFYIDAFARTRPARTREGLEGLACRHAKEMCRMVFSFSRLTAIANAHWMSLMLRIAHGFFEDFGATREAEWCLGCGIATRLRIKRMEKTEPPTLCRMANLGATANVLAGCARYKPRSRTPSPHLADWCVGRGV